MRNVLTTTTQTIEKQNTSTLLEATHLKPHPRSLSVSKAEWKQEDARLKIKGRAGAAEKVTVFDAKRDSQLVATKTERDGSRKIEFKIPEIIPCHVRAESGHEKSEREIKNVPKNCGGNAVLAIINSLMK